eukprot:TRINITY_DN42883_c0_g1_i1.p1 TRINITY_DN42883_c0_g1~~TRINITY_DN42883_c0_g1_i1.p1  ORF type:complete len:381 (+),score=85.48 TRINITY_DN42883_c0_g1_i1:61-1143(+)
MAATMTSELTVLKQQHDQGLLDQDQYKIASDAVVQRFAQEMRAEAAGLHDNPHSMPPPRGRPQTRYQPYPPQQQLEYSPTPPGPPQGSWGRQAGGGDRRAPAPRQEMKRGDWACPSCGNHNFARRSLCHHCMYQRPPEAGPVLHSQLLPGALSTGGEFQGPEHEEAVLQVRNFIRAGHGNKESWAAYCAKHAEDKRDPKWHSAEFLWNALEWLSGGGPKDPPPRQIGPPPYANHANHRRAAAPQYMVQGDWMCPECNNHNFAFRSVCISCLSPRPPEAGAPVGNGKDILPGALQTGGEVQSEGHRQAIDELKDHVRNTPGAKQAWAAYCEVHAEGRRDPKWHTEEFLRTFMESHILQCTT